MWQVAGVLAVSAGAGLMAWYAYVFRKAEGLAAGIKFMCLAFALAFNLLGANVIHQLTASSTVTGTAVGVGAYLAWIVGAAVVIYFVWELFRGWVSRDEKSLA